jgi:hypothetical protein
VELPSELSGLQVEEKPNKIEWHRAKSIWAGLTTMKNAFHESPRHYTSHARFQLQNLAQRIIFRRSPEL